MEVDRTTWLATGADLRCKRQGEGPAISGRVGPLPPIARALRLHEGDTLVLTADLTPATPPEPGAPAHIGCTLPEIFQAVRPGHRISLDDGAMDGEITAVDPGHAEIRITRTATHGAKLRAEKGRQAALRGALGVHVVRIDDDAFPEKLLAATTNQRILLFEQSLFARAKGLVAAFPLDQVASVTATGTSRAQVSLKILEFTISLRDGQELELESADPKGADELIRTVQSRLA